MSASDLIIFQTDAGKTEIQVRLEKITVWLSQKQMAELFEKDSGTIGLHLKNIYKASELNKQATTGEYPVVQTEGRKMVRRKIRFYEAVDQIQKVKKRDHY